MKKIFVAIVLIAGFSASAQVKIGDNPTVLNAGALLELQSDAGNKGLKFPEVALTSTTVWGLAGGTQVRGMTVYNTANAGDVTPGLYTSNNSFVWVKNEAAAVAPLNKTALITGNYTALATDDIILVNIMAIGYTLTLPTSGISIGKKYYVSNNGTQILNLSPLPREGGVQYVDATAGITLMYLGGSGDGSWSIVSGF
jgi:hypothetical protein